MFHRDFSIPNTNISHAANEFAWLWFFRGKTTDDDTISVSFDTQGDMTAIIRSRHQHFILEVKFELLINHSKKCPDFESKTPFSLYIFYNVQHFGEVM